MKTNSIIHGNCIDILSTIPYEYIDLVITDPPYFLDGLDNDWKKGTAPRSTGAIKGLPVGMKFDPIQGINLQNYINRVGKMLFPVMKPGSFAVFFSQPRLSHRMAVGLEDAGFEIRDILAWRFTKKAQFKAFSMNHFIDKMDETEIYKENLKKEMHGRKTPQFRPQHENMILAQKPKNGTFLQNWIQYKTGLIDTNIQINKHVPSTITTVEKPKKEITNTHLTVKPIEIIEYLIKVLSSKNQIVLDPFLGSGTTAIAAKRTNRQYIGMEINQEYVDIAEQRIIDHKNS